MLICCQFFNNFAFSNSLFAVNKQVSTSERNIWVLKNQNIFHYFMVFPSSFSGGLEYPPELANNVGFGN